MGDSEQTPEGAATSRLYKTDWLLSRYEVDNLIKVMSAFYRLNQLKEIGYLAEGVYLTPQRMGLPQAGTPVPLRHHKPWTADQVREYLYNQAQVPKLVLKDQVKPEKVTRALDHQVIVQAPRSVEPT